MPRDFRFGVATADHQCEAYTGQDDVRDVWERVRGLTARGRATDFWNRYREDADLAKSLGCRAFRISLAWARLEPEPGKWDDDAFGHYRDVLQYLRGAGMATVVSLHHNAWPLHVQAAGNGAGMLDADFPARMEAYASQIVQRLGEWIDYYVTLNEPNQLVYGYIKGFWMRAYAAPPGLEPFATSDEQMDAVLRLIPNLFRAHARARQAIRAVQPTARVGANPLILGLPRWLQSWVDRNVTHLKTPQQARRQAARLSQVSLLDSGSVDITIAQLTMTQARAEHVLFSEPYFVAHLAGLHPVSLAIPSKLDTWQIRVGVQPGVNGLCVSDGAGNYTGLEPDLARQIARFVLSGDDPKVAFVPLSGQRRLSATRSWLQLFDGLRKSIAMFGTLLGTNWWNLGMAGKLPHFLCPSECVGALDYVGLDYYWGVPSVWPGQLQRLAAAADFHYANAPVWPNVLDQILQEAQAQFPGKPIVVIENGCVTSADGFSRAEYLSAHIAQVERALQRGAPIDAYLCWSITSNREWGLPFNDGSDFGLYHIDLDGDPNLTRTPTEASTRYAKIIADAESS